MRIGFILLTTCLGMLLAACGTAGNAPPATSRAASEPIQQAPTAAAVEAPRLSVVFFYSPL